MARPRANPPVKRRCVTLTDEQVKLLRMWGRGDVSAGLRWLVDTVAPLIRRAGVSQPQQPPTRQP